MQEIWILSLGQEDTLEKTIATHSSFLAWRIPWTEELGGLQSLGSQNVGHDWMTNTFTFTSHICLYFLHPLIYWWTLRSLPYLGYYKQCSNKQRCIYLFKLVLFPSLDKYPDVELLDCTVVLFFLMEKPPYNSLSCLHHFTIPPTVCKFSFTWYTHQHLLHIMCYLFQNSPSDQYWRIHHCEFNLHFPDDYGAFLMAQMVKSLPAM